MKYLVVFAAFICAWVTAAPANEAAGNTKPNFLFILTDDQDYQLESMNYMQGVKTHLTDQGAYFTHHYCTVALCCPSRVSMWTGKAAHNTNVTDLKPSYGGYPKFIAEGYYQKWLPTWLKKAGYNTYFTGKLMNYHTINNYKDHLNDLDLDGHAFMIEPGTYDYLNTTFQEGNDKPKSYPGIYATDLLANKSLGYLDQAVKLGDPWFMAINPVNPHANHGYKTGGSPPIVADRYKGLFADVKVPRNAAFNPNQSSGASWVKDLQQMNESEVARLDDYYRRRLGALQAVDDLVNRTIDRLNSYGILNNTYIFYTSDNGFHLGQHRLSPGKRCPYETDINVPLVIRGPGIPAGTVHDFVTSHIDLTPTIVEWAGATSPGDFDGVSIPVNGIQTNGSIPSPKQAWEHVEVEHWGTAADEEKVDERTEINTYKAIRIVSDDYSLYYSVWCDGSHEVYDMKADPVQMKNLYNTTTDLMGVSMSKLQDRLDALTLVLKTCAGRSCYDPWSALHPDSNVTTLVEALNTEYDDFYASQDKVKYEHCAKGYILANEMPIHFNTYGNQSSVAAREAEAWRRWSIYVD